MSFTDHRGNPVPPVGPSDGRGAAGRDANVEPLGIATALGPQAAEAADQGQGAVGAAAGDERASAASSTRTLSAPLFPTTGRGLSPMRVSTTTVRPRRPTSRAPRAAAAEGDGFVATPSPDHFMRGSPGVDLAMPPAGVPPNLPAPTGPVPAGAAPPWIEGTHAGERTFAQRQQAFDWMQRQAAYPAGPLPQYDPNARVVFTPGMAGNMPQSYVVHSPGSPEVKNSSGNNRQARRRPAQPLPPSRRWSTT